MNFKVGDWVRWKGKEKIFQVEESHLNFPSYWWRNIEQWQPKEDEYCWIRFKTQPYPVLRPYGMVKEFINDCTDVIEPFIGTLPTFIKEIKYDSLSNCMGSV